MTQQELRDIIEEAYYELLSEGLITEAEEDVAFEILGRDDRLVAKVPKAEVKNSQNLVHSLHIFYTSVETGVDEQDASQCVRMSLNIIGNRFA